ncbi:hypothetical protein [Ktedonosporobacter rubrisoli]|uniref:Tc toxin subunit A-related protein n=1 Tax=Ktedonosporobacter rubrisoli TaxID=2509675 RepID=UPI0013EE918A
MNDSGLFELSFRDERYLPSEGTGAISSWRLSLPRTTKRFDFASLSDVIIQLNYTALDGGQTFTESVQRLSALQSSTGAYYLNFRQVFSGAWFTFLSDHTDAQSRQLEQRQMPRVLSKVEKAEKEYETTRRVCITPGYPRRH